MHKVKVHMPKRPVFRLKRNPLASRLIPSQSSSGLWIDQLMRLDSLGGMQIKCYLEALLCSASRNAGGSGNNVLSQV